MFIDFLECYTSFLVALAIFALCLFLAYWKASTVMKICSYTLVLPIVIFFLFVSKGKYNSPERISGRVEYMISTQNYAKAHSQLKNLRNRINKKAWKKKEALEVLYEPLETKLFNAEITYLINDNSSGTTERIVYLIQELQVFGVPTLGVVSNKDVQSENEKYMRSVSRKNHMIDGVLSQAIIYYRYDLAEKIFPLYRPNLNKKLYESHFFSSDEYIYDYTNEDRDAAEEKYRLARSKKCSY